MNMRPPLLSAVIFIVLLCLPWERASGQLTPAVFDVVPMKGVEGDVITIIGENFALNALDNCAIVKDGTRTTGIFIEKSDGQMLQGRLLTVPLDAGPGEIGVATGTGVQDFFVPIFDDIIVIEPPWVWNFDGEDGGPGPKFTQIPTPPPPGVQWFFSEPIVEQQDTAVCVILDRPWPKRAKVRIEGRVRARNGEGHDALFACLEFDLPNPTVRDCAERICDSIRCAFLQNLGVVINCEVENLDPETSKVRFSTENNRPLVLGNLTVCVLDLNPPIPPPIIDDVIPLSAVEGDVITIVGENFALNPLDNCAIVKDGTRTIGIFIEESDGQTMQGRLLTVPLDAEPGEVGVATGTGIQDTFNPIFDDIIVVEPPWTWDFDGADAGTGPTFTPMPVPAPPGVQWFFSERITAQEDTAVCVVLDRPWPERAKVEISGRVRARNGEGHDALFACLEFNLPNPTVRDCAERICDSLRCAFLQNSGVLINCEVENIDPDTSKIRLSTENSRPLVLGNITVCVSDANVPPPIIDDVIPRNGIAGDQITIIGDNFALDPLDNCAIVKDGTRTIGIFIEASDGQTMQGRLLTVPLDAEPGEVDVATGTGIQDVFDPIFDDIIVVEPPWTWNFDGLAAGQGPTFTPIPTPPPPGVQRFISERIEPQDTAVCVVLDRPWPERAKVEISGRVLARNGEGHDALFACLEFNLPNPTVRDCAERICDSLRCAFLQNSGVLIRCEVENIDPDTAKIRLSTENNRPLSRGNITVCVSDPNRIRFIRGDCNGDGIINFLVDALFLLNCGFVPGSPCAPCEASADVNGDRIVNHLVDALFLLNCGFVPGSACPPPPFPECGNDENGIAALGCVTPDPVCNP